MAEREDCEGDEYLMLDDVLLSLRGKNAESLRQLYSDNSSWFSRAGGSHHNHQVWCGGYLDHMAEVCNIARLMYTSLNSKRTLSFSLDDALEVLLVHDVEKPWKYQYSGDNLNVLSLSCSSDDWRISMMKKYNIVFSPLQENALKYVHGELDEYSSTIRVASPLASFVHCCDFLSARVWFDHPFMTGDSWSGCKRNLVE